MFVLLYKMRVRVQYHLFTLHTNIVVMAIVVTAAVVFGLMAQQPPPPVTCSSTDTPPACSAGPSEGMLFQVLQVRPPPAKRQPLLPSTIIFFTHTPRSHTFVPNPRQERCVLPQQIR